MTDEQIVIELARQVMGWKIAPDEGWIEWSKDKANYPHVAGDTYYDSILADPEPWRPLIDWTDAMALAEKWAGTTGIFQVHYRSNGTYFCGCQPNIKAWDAVRKAEDKCGPRAVSLAVAKAAGITTEGQNDG